MLAYLYDIVEIKPISIEFLFKGIGSVIGIYLLYLRFKTTDDIKKSHDKQFHLTNQYKNFLETSKLLTDKDSTIEAKISAMYLLYDYAKNYPEEIEKVYQLLSEYIKPLLNCIENNCNTSKYITVKDSLEIEKSSKKIIYSYKAKKNLDLDVYNQDNNLLEIINKWQINGTNTEKEISISLIILRDLTTNISPNINEHIELSNIIIFNLNVDFVEDRIKFKSIIRPTYNLIFLNCNLKGVDFSNSKFYYCKFINCDLDNASFNNCDLNKSLFFRSDFKNIKFNNVDLRNIEFIECTNRFFKKLNKIKFSSNLKVLTMEDFQYHWIQFCKKSSEF
jgi:hypothetical protein